MSEYSSRFLQNLAGNSFNVANAMVCIVCVLSGLTVAGEDAAATRFIAFNFNPAVDSDGDDDAIS